MVESTEPVKNVFNVSREHEKVSGSHEKVSGAHITGCMRACVRRQRVSADERAVACMSF